MLHLPENIPAAETLGAATYELGKWCEVEGVCRVLLLNLMPEKAVTELDIARTLQATQRSVQIIPVKLKGQKFKTTPQAHMEAFYLDIEDLMDLGFDRLIVTGAPLEQMPFEEVRYWEALCRVMDWADRKVERTLYVCWGAQAGLYHFYHIDKHPLSEKMFGIFPQRVVKPESPLMKNLSPRFPMPNSRHTEVRLCDMKQAFSQCGLELLAESEESGVGVLASADIRRTFIVGHLEYEPYTLHREYHRDLNKNLPIHAPEHYYNETGDVIYAWEAAAKHFYNNWLNWEQ